MNFKEKVITVFSYNQDDYSSISEAIDAGNFSEIDVTESEWEMFIKATKFASINYSGEMKVELYHRNRLLDTCGIWNMPKEFPIIEPTYIVSLVIEEHIHKLHSDPMTIDQLKQYLDVRLIESLEDDDIFLPVCIDADQVYAYQFNDEPYLIKRIK
jgi:hypothetical protein